MQSSASIQPRTDHPNLGLPVGPTPLRPVRKRRLPGRPASARRARKEPSGPDPPASAAYRRLRKPGRVGGREGLKNKNVSLEPGGRSFSSLPSLLLLPPSFSFFDLFLFFSFPFFPSFKITIRGVLGTVADPSWYSRNSGNNWACERSACWAGPGGEKRRGIRSENLRAPERRWGERPCRNFAPQNLPLRKGQPPQVTRGSRRLGTRLPEGS